MSPARSPQRFSPKLINRGIRGARSCDVDLAIENLSQLDGTNFSYHLSTFRVKVQGPDLDRGKNATTACFCCWHPRVLDIGSIYNYSIVTGGTRRGFRNNSVRLHTWRSQLSKCIRNIQMPLCHILELFFYKHSITTLPMIHDEYASAHFILRELT